MGKADVHTQILVIDGHDGSGKTTLAQTLARDLGATHIRPFSGEQGASILATAEAGQVDEANRIAREMVDTALDSAPTSILVMDRQWMTMFTLLPERLWQHWLPLPPTLLCFCSLSTTLSRLAERSEAQAPRTWHETYLKRYQDLARQFEVPLLRTDRLSRHAALQHAVAWSSFALEEPS
jgi:adenylate kinase family enzyme